MQHTRKSSVFQMFTYWEKLSGTHLMDWNSRLNWMLINKKGQISNLRYWNIHNRTKDLVKITIWIKMFYLSGFPNGFWVWFCTYTQMYNFLLFIFLGGACVTITCSHDERRTHALLLWQPVVFHVIEFKLLNPLASIDELWWHVTHLSLNLVLEKNTSADHVSN